MSDKKVRILGIAPYEGMRSIMLKAAEARNDIDLTVYVGDLQEGAEIAKRSFHDNYDIIISRGGTAELIGQITPIPVVEIPLSVYDILRAIKMAENFASRYAIVGFPGIISSAKLLCDMLQYKVETFTIHNSRQVEETLQMLKKRGYRMILCDMIASTTAKRLGLNAILITSGNESISSAFDQAVKLCSSYANVREENRFLREVIRTSSQSTVIFDSQGQIFYSSLPENEENPVIQALKKDLPSASETPHKSFKNIDGTLYSITSRLVSFCGDNYPVFQFTDSKVPFATSKYGVQYLNRIDVENSFFNSFFSVTGAIGPLRNTIVQMAQTQHPIMIFGEEGTGKEQAAAAVYNESPLRNNPFITVNFALMNDKSWNFLTNHYNSPFNDNNNTIYLKNLHVLDEERARKLLSIIVDMNLCHRNRLIFSCVCSRSGEIPKTCMEFVNLLTCLTIRLKPLRERTEDIPTLANLYLSNLNVSLAKEILGLTPGAMELLKSFDWPENYTQFKRILSELTVITTSSYITEETLSGLLEMEKKTTFRRVGPGASPSGIEGESGVSHSSSVILDLKRPLDEINQDIIHAVLEETKGNQTAAAKRLGISRTTLWRLLKS